MSSMSSSVESKCSATMAVKSTWRVLVSWLLDSTVTVESTLLGARAGRQPPTVTVESRNWFALPR